MQSLTLDRRIGLPCCLLGILLGLHSASANPPNATANQAGPTIAAADNSPSAQRDASGSAVHKVTRGRATQRADGHIRYAFDLAGRGVVYSAQAEFLQGLELVAQVLDTQEGTQKHSQALAAGLRALNEAEDFTPEDSHQGATIDLSRRIATHRTPVLREADPKTLTPLTALQSYFTYAKDQLTAAGGHEQGASVALYGLGRLQPVLSRRLATPTAIALHQAALTVDANNHLAANELAVLCFRTGQVEEARLLLVHSIKLSPRSETWHNLAVVYDDLGRSEDARKADKYYKQALAAEREREQAGGTSGGMVYWVDKEKFLQSPDPAGLDGPSPVARGEAKKAPAPPANTTATSGEETWGSRFTKGMQDMGLAKRPASTVTK